MTAGQVGLVALGAVCMAPVAATFGAVVMAVLASPKVEDAQRARRAAPYTGPTGTSRSSIPAQVCLPCRLGECGRHEGGRR